MTIRRPRDRAAIIDSGFAMLQRWGIRVIVLAVALYIVGWVVGQTWVIWFPVAMSMLFATVLSPPARWLREHRVPPAAAAGIVMLAFLGALGALFSIVIPQLVDESPQIADRAALGVGKVQDWLVDGPLSIEQGEITNILNSFEQWVKDSAIDISTGVLSTLGTAASVVFNIILVLMLTFLFIKDGHRFLPALHRVSGHRVGNHIVAALGRTWQTLGGFIRTQGLVSLIDAVLIGAGLLIVDVPLAIPLAVIVFVGGFIPIIGAFATGALAVLVTLVTNSPKDAVIILVIIIIVQQLEGNVLSPMLQGKSMNLHPAVVLLGVAAGGSMYGITGAFLAVPVVASVVELLRYIDEQITLAAVEPESTTPAITAHASPDPESSEDSDPPND